MLGFLTVRVWLWICAVLGIALVVAVMAFVARGAQLDRARASIKVVEAELRQAKVTIAGYEDAVRQCNAATEKLKTVAAEKAAAADQALARAQQEARKHQPSVQKRAAILVAPTPSGAGCSQAVAAIRAELK